MLLRTAFSLASPGGRKARLSILIFHRVHARPDRLFPEEPDCRRFDEILGWLKSWFNIIPLDQAIQRLPRDELPARAAAITFDDGYADNFTQALPILKRHGLHATIFVATGFLDGGRMWNDTLIESVRRTEQAFIDAQPLMLDDLPVGTLAEKRSTLHKLIPAIKHLAPREREAAVASIARSARVVLPDDLMLSTRQVKALRQSGMGIGAHTVSHPILAVTDAKKAREEISASRDALQTILGERIGLFAYPNGKTDADYRRTHVDMVRSLGFDAAVTTQPGACHAESSLYELPRFTPWDRNKWRFGLRMLLNVGGQRPHAFR